MSQVINTNVMSLNAQRNLSRSSGALAQSLARLSSGLRINSAKDDAAGLAISERFTTQIRGMNQAIRNANDGISLAQVAEGALQEVANNLQRIRELAVQARNATNSDSDRAALDAEVQQRIAEINRVATQTEFNGLKVLDGSFTEQVFQVGANYGQTISVDSISAATAQALGLAGGTLTDYVANGTNMTAALNAGDLTINGVDVGAVEQDATALAAAINATGTGVIATATNSQDIAFDDIIADNDAGDSYSLSIDGHTLFDEVQIAVTADDVADAIDALDGYTAVNNGGTITITKEDGSNFELVETIVDNDATTDQTGTGFGASPTGTSYSGKVSLTSAESFTIGGNAVASAGLTQGAATQQQTTYNAINVLQATEADTVLRVIDQALTTVNSSRADLGAVQNRFESVVANLSTSVENLSASRSRILDTDFAAETAALTRAQVLQQAGVAMLAQANMMPQNVLALLR
ncbi:MAG TPA: flagellin [Gammaproteobacteria bacterium]